MRDADKAIGNLNIKFGWGWLFLAILLAMGMGLFSFTPDWLGGYTALPRRFLRLAHISFMALSLTNVLYGLCIDRVSLPITAKKIGSYCMVLAAVLMPFTCLLSMFDSFFQKLFFIPALSCAAAIFIMAWGQLKKQVIP